MGFWIIDNNLKIIIIKTVNKSIVFSLFSLFLINIMLLIICCISFLKELYKGFGNKKRVILSGATVGQLELSDLTFDVVFFLLANKASFITL